MKLKICKNYFSVYLLLCSFSNYAQDSSQNKIDTCHFQQINNAGFKIYPYNKKRIQLVTAGNILGYGGVLIGLNTIWYSKFPRSEFHFFNDNAEWLQVDKAGHTYGAYIESRTSYEMWRWTGLSRKKRIWIGGLSGLAYQSIIEILDGFSSEYGFSVGDYMANILGSSIFITQELAWDDQRVKLKFSFHRKDYGSPDLNARANNIYGKSQTTRFIEDYNAVTDWASIDLKSFFNKVNIPPWFAIAVGYGAEGMFGARSNIAKDKNGYVTFDRSDIKRYRQWFLAPDFDLCKIKTNKKNLKIILTILSAFKFPTPSLEFSNGNIKGHWIHF